jgi:hypothetical protein
MYTSTSNLLQLFRYNEKELMKYLIANIDLSKKNITNEYLNDKLKDYLSHDIAKDLNKDINMFWKTGSFLNKLYFYFEKNISKKDLNLLIQFVKDVYKLDYININDYINIMTLFNNYINNSNVLIFEDKLNLINNLKDLIKLISENKLSPLKEKRSNYLDLINKLFILLNINKDNNSYNK